MSEKLLACTSIGSCAVGFFAAALPVLQYIAVLLAIASAVKALWPKKGK